MFCLWQNPVAYRLPTLALRGPGYRQHNLKDNGKTPKPPDQKRIKTVNVAFTESEYNDLQQQAGTKSIADLIRQLLKGKQQAAPVSDDERKALFQIAGMARNLNQLAAQANAQGYGAVATRTNILADQLRELRTIYDRKS